MANQTPKKGDGQATVEYVLMLAVIIAVLVIFLNGIFRTTFDAALQTSTDGMANMADRLTGLVSNGVGGGASPP